MNDNKMPSHWKLISLGDFCSIQNGFPFKSAYFSTEEGIPLIRVRSLKAQNCDIYFKGEYEKSFLVNNEDILIGMDGDFQPCCWKGGKALLNQRVCKLVDFDERLDCDFAFHAIMKPLEKIQKNTFYTTVKHISSSKILEIEIPLPPLPEQRAIARVLRTVQAAREARLREIALERERKAALMEHLFTHGTRGESTKMTEIGEMPESWEDMGLSELIIDGPQNGLYKPLELYGDGVSIIRIDDFNNDGSFVNLNFKKVQLSSEEAKKYKVQENDIIINRVNSLSHLGKCALIPNLPEATVFESNMMRFQVDESRILPEFLLRYLVTDENKDRIRNKAKRAVAQSSINQGDVKSLKVPLPLLSEQEEISEALKACDSKINSLIHEAQLLDKLFKSMLEELMTGRIRILKI